MSRLLEQQRLSKEFVLAKTCADLIKESLAESKTNLVPARFECFLREIPYMSSKASFDG